jgi:hypothetical protein
VTCDTTKEMVHLFNFHCQLPSPSEDFDQFYNVTLCLSLSDVIVMMALMHN